MPTPIFHVNAFTDRRFGGNPAAVCLLDEEVHEATLQDIAEQMNLSETAFLRRGKDGYHLRWFTPCKEVDLCGHATLAAAHVLWSEGHLPSAGEAIFHTRSGRLSARRDGERIELDFPSRPATPADPPPGLLDALGGPAPDAVARSDRDWLVQYEDPTTVERLRPDFRVIRELDTCVIVTAGCADERGDVDFVSRFFAPSYGIDEDPVTGSAHCVLGPWWADRTGRNQLHGEQVSRRGGHVNVRVDGDRTHLGGSAATVLRGVLEFELSPSLTA